MIGYRTTLIILALGLPTNLILTTMGAYALSKDNFPLKKLFTWMILFTMLFSGGIVPLYLVVKQLGLTNNVWSVVLVNGINTFYLIITRQYFISMPTALRESARIDGASEMTVFFKIMLPLALPMLATITLFYAVDRWNEWFHSLIFLRKNNFRTLQTILRSIINDAQISDVSGAASALGEAKSVKAIKGMKMASIVLTMLPIMCVYPFLQKYFVKGMLIGAIKA